MGTTPDSYHRTEDFESRVDSVRLPDEAWAVFAQLEQPAGTDEIAGKLGLDTAAVQKSIDLLIESKLVRKRLMNWREFLAQKGISTTPKRMSPAGPQPPPAVIAANARREPAPGAARPAPAPEASEPASVPPAAQGETAPASTPAPAAKPQASRPTPAAHRISARISEPVAADPENTLTFRLGNDDARRARRASLSMCITFRLGTHVPAARIAPAAPPPPAPVAPPARIAVPEPEPEPELVGACVTNPQPSATGSGFVPRRLRTLIDAITRKGGGGLKGQLLVYRVFLRVPPAVMYSAGIKSPSLVDDTLEVHDESVYDVIRNAARSVASIDLDEAAS